MDKESPELIQTDSKPTVRYRGRFLYSRKDPEKSTVKRIHPVQLQPNTLIVAPSPVLFYGFSELIQILPPDCHILCIEADEKLMAFSTYHLPDFIACSTAVTFIRTDNPGHLQRVLDTIRPWNFRKASFLPLSGGYALYPEIYKKMFSIIENSIRSKWQNRMTSIHMASRWFRNIFKNLVNLDRVVPAIPPLADPLPVFVVGAGISLEDTIPFLHACRERFFLLAVDTALPILERNNLVPDGICAMDGQVYNQYDFLGTHSFTAILFTDLTTYPGTIRLFTGPKFCFVSEFSNSSFFNRLQNFSLLPEKVPPLGSIGVTALYLAKKITTGPVFFSGLDFSYIVGKTHARGAPSHTSILSVSNRKNPPLAYGLCMERPLIRTAGKVDSPNAQVITDFVLYSYLDPFNAVIGDDGRCFDVSTGGVRNNAVHIIQKTDIDKVISGHKAQLKEKRSSVDISREDHAIVGPEKIIQFLREEHTLLTDAVRKGTYFITTDQSSESTRKVHEALARVDYIYQHFPDTQPLVKIDVGFVKRAVLSAQKYAELVQNSLCVLGFQDG